MCEAALTFFPMMFVLFSKLALCSALISQSTYRTQKQGNMSRCLGAGGGGKGEENVSEEAGWRNDEQL